MQTDELLDERQAATEASRDAQLLTGLAAPRRRTAIPEDGRVVRYRNSDLDRISRCERPFFNLRSWPVGLMTPSRLPADPGKNRIGVKRSGPICSGASGRRGRRPWAGLPSGGGTGVDGLTLWFRAGGFPFSRRSLRRVCGGTFR